MTKTQLNHLDKAKATKKGIKIGFSAAAIKYMTKTGGIFPLLAAIPELIASAAPAIAKAAALGAVGTAAGMALKKATGKGYKKGSKSKTSRNFSVMVSKALTPLLTLAASNFDLLDAVKRLNIKHFRGVLMRDQLPQRPNNVETGIINLDNKDGPGTHWVAYAIDLRGIIYSDSYGLTPPAEFLRYIQKLSNISGRYLWQSTLPTQTLTDPPICGQEVLNVLDAISRNPKIPPQEIVHKYTASQFENSNNV